jgi:hypothetical protein
MAVLLSAAAVVLGLGAVAVVGVQPATRVSTSALLPEARRADPGSQPSSDGTLAAVDVAQPDLDGPDVAAPSAPGSGHDARGVTEAVQPSGATPVVVGSPPLRGLGARAPSSQPAPATLAEETGNRVSEALTQPAKVQQPPAPPKKLARRVAVARRAKPGPAPAAAAKATTSKVDCRQPFWIDEGGIRRLKMACL